MPATRLRIFVSSVQKEFEPLRHDLKAFLLGDASRFGVSKPTATRDLDGLVSKGVLERVGTTGKGTRYVLRRKGLTKGSKGSSPRTPRKGS